MVTVTGSKMASVVGCEPTTTVWPASGEICMVLPPALLANGETKPQMVTSRPRSRLCAKPSPLPSTIWMVWPAGPVVAASESRIQ